MQWHNVGPRLWCNESEDAIYKVSSDAPLIHIEAEIAAGTAIKYVPEVLTIIDMYTEDGIVGHSTCMNCGKTVHRQDRYCWHCGAVLTNSASKFWR